MVDLQGCSQAGPQKHGATFAGGLFMTNTKARTKFIAGRAIALRGKVEKPTHRQNEYGGRSEGRGHAERMGGRVASRTCHPGTGVGCASAAVGYRVGSHMLPFSLWNLIRPNAYTVGYSGTNEAFGLGAVGWVCCDWAGGMHYTGPYAGSTGGSVQGVPHMPPGIHGDHSG